MLKLINFKTFSQLDNEFFELQELLSNMLSLRPHIILSELIDYKDLSIKLIDQNKLYSRKIIELNEELTRIKVFYSKEYKPNSEHKFNDEDASCLKGMNQEKFFKYKIEYLNKLIIENKKTIEKQNSEIYMLESTNNQFMQEIKDLKNIINDMEKKDKKQQLGEILLEDNLKFLQKIQTPKSLLNEKPQEKLMINESKQRKNITEFLEENQKKSGIDLENHAEREKDKMATNEILQNSSNSKTKNKPDVHNEIESLDPTFNHNLYHLDHILEDIRNVSLDILTCLDLSPQSHRKFEEKKNSQVNDRYTMKILQYSKSGIEIRENLKIVIYKLNQQRKAELVNKKNETKISPPKGILKEYEQEIKSRLKESLNKIETSNYTEIYNQLQLQIDINTKLNTKLENILKAIHEVKLITIEEIYGMMNYIELNNQGNMNRQFINTTRSKLTNLEGIFERIFKHSNENNIHNIHINSDITKHKLIHEITYPSHKDENIGKIEENMYKIEENPMKFTEWKTIINENNVLKNEIKRYKDQIYEMNEEYRIYKDEMNLKIDILEKKIKNENEKVMKYCLDVISQIKKNQMKIFENQDIFNDFEVNNEYLLDEISIIDYFKRIVNSYTKWIRCIELEYDNLKERFTKNEKIIEELRMKLCNDNDNGANKEKENENEEEKRIAQKLYLYLKSDYEKYVEDQEKIINQIKEYNQKFKQEHKQQINELNLIIENLKANHNSELQAKIELVAKYEENLAKIGQERKLQDEKIQKLIEEIERLTKENRELNTRLSGNNKGLSELALTKDKNKELLDLLGKNTNDFENLKHEYQSLLNQNNELKTKITNINRDDIELKKEISTMREIMLIEQEEIKLLKTHKEDLNREISKKDEEIRMLADKVKLKESPTFKDEIIKKSREDMNSLIKELDNLKQEYQKIIEKNEILIEQINDYKTKTTTTATMITTALPTSESAINHYKKPIINQGLSLIPQKDKKHNKVEQLEDSYFNQKVSYVKEIEPRSKYSKALERRLSFKDA